MRKRALLLLSPLALAFGVALAAQQGQEREPARPDPDSPRQEESLQADPEGDRQGEKERRGKKEGCDRKKHRDGDVERTSTAAV